MGLFETSKALKKPELIVEGYEVISHKDFPLNRLSVAEKAEIKKLGITIRQLSKRLEKLVTRTANRNYNYIPNRYSFYRAIIYAIQQEQTKRTKKTATEILKEYDIHSVSRLGYEQFQLLPRKIHKKAHSNNLIFQCSSCFEWKPKEEMATNNKSLLKIHKKLCKICWNAEVRDFKKKTKEEPQQVA